MRAIGRGIRRKIDNFNAYCNNGTVKGDALKVIREVVPAYLAMRGIGEISGSEGIETLMEYAAPVSAVVGAYHGSKDTRTIGADTAVVLTCALAGMDLDRAIHAGDNFNVATQYLVRGYDAIHHYAANFTHGHKSGYALATVAGAVSGIERAIKGLTE